MSTFELQKLTRQNTNLTQQLKQLQHQLSLTQNTQKHHKQLQMKWQKQKQFLQQQIKQLRRKQEEMKYQKQQTNNRYANVLRKLEDELEDRKCKYLKLQTKIQPLLDPDTIRLKILNQVQSVHFLQLQQQSRKINSLKDQLLKLKRQNQLLKHTIQSKTQQYQNQLRRLHNSYQDNTKYNHINEISYEMCMEIQNRLRINYQQAKKEADYYKDKYFCLEKKYQDRVGQLEKEIGVMKEKIFK